MPEIRYRATHYNSVALGFDSFLVCAPGSNLRLVISSQAKRILDNCHSSDTLEGLAARVSRQLYMPVKDHGLVSTTIQDLLSLGLIASEKAIIENIPIPNTRGNNIKALAFPSADRILELRRALVSYAGNIHRYGRSIEIIVMDDSKSTSRSDYMQGIKGCKAGLVIRYAGLPEKKSYIDALVRLGVQPEIARFALLGDFKNVAYTPGANRNAILLDTAGDCILTADDDSLCTLASHPNRDRKLYLNGAGDPRDKWFYSDREHVYALNTWIEDDLIGEHECLLGKQLSALVLDSKDNVEIQNACGHELDAIHTGCGAIAATMTGVAGDSGMYTSSSFLRSTGDTQARLCESEAIFKCALTSREMLAVVRGHTITHDSFCMAGQLGLANFEMLPPFFPVGKNQDGVFGMLIRRSTPHFLAHIPLAVYHAPPFQRKYQKIPQCRISDVILSLILSLVPPDRHGTLASLRFLGQGMRDIGELTDSEFAHFTRHAVCKQTGERLRMIESILKRFPQCPAYWLEEVASLFRQSTETLQDPAWWVPIELRNGRSLDFAKSALKELVVMTGNLFHHWPDIVDAARSLRKRGQRISTVLPC